MAVSERAITESVPTGADRTSTTSLGRGALIIIPTYNERENIAALVRRVVEQLPECRVLIMDDNSPDGTGQIGDELAESDSRVRVVHRPSKDGLGKAYLAGFRQALASHAEYVFQMDADFSHDPAYLPTFLELIERADLVIGSRYVAGGGVTNWGVHRKLISGLGNAFARTVLELPVRDATAGFRCYRRTVLDAIDLDSIQSEGYAFQIEMAYRAHQRGFRVAEFPIIFPDRVHGRSKMSKKIIAEALLFVIRSRLGLR